MGAVPRTTGGHQDRTVIITVQGAITVVVGVEVYDTITVIVDLVADFIGTRMDGVVLVVTVPIILGVPVSVIVTEIGIGIGVGVGVGIGIGIRIRIRITAHLRSLGLFGIAIEFG
jgi:NF-X1-type zinc finger protein NFXL1